jgi:hypothetical protein
MPAGAQELDPNNSDGDHGGFTLTPELDQTVVDSFGVVNEVEQEQVAGGAGAILRALDKVSGEVTDLEIGAGQSLSYGRLEVQMSECRYPKDNPSGDAYAYLVIRAAQSDRPSFQGWMVASSPALNALDHPRYDVWVLRCITS